MKILCKFFSFFCKSFVRIFSLVKILSLQHPPQIHNYIERWSAFHRPFFHSLSQKTRDPASREVVISGEALSSSPWPKYLTPDWLIHIPGVELGYMLCVRHGAQCFLSNGPMSVQPVWQEEQLIQEEVWAGDVWGGRWGGVESSARGGPTVHVNYQFGLWPPCQHEA